VEDVDPVWIGIGATAFAVVVFANGYRLFDLHIDRKMGLFHMILAPVFIATTWTILAMNGALS
jgi:dipeptide/tripeptide permease